MSDETAYFLDVNRGFGEMRREDDLLHRQFQQTVTDPTLTETQYFDFVVPEANIQSILYMWHHPHMGVLSGGAFVWQGTKRHTQQAEICDFRTYMTDEALKDDLHEYRMDNGFGVRVVEPTQHLHVTYADPNRDSRFDLHYRAVQPAVLAGDGNHIDQAMKVTGELVLRGKRFEVDCYSMRDRSWGKPRHENNMPLPPISACTGVFDDGFSFSCFVFDDPVSNPALPADLALPAGKTIPTAWVYRDGALRRVVDVRKTILRDPLTLFARSVRLEMTDETGQVTIVDGAVTTAWPWGFWHTQKAVQNLVRWECEGKVAHGNCMEAFWTDYLVRCTQ